MEAAFRAISVPCLILRGGDYIDPLGGRTLFDMMTKSIPKGRLPRFGAVDALHADAPLGDMARAAVALAAALGLPDFADIPFARLAFAGQNLQAEVARQLGRPVAVSVSARRKMEWPHKRLPVAGVRGKARCNLV